MLAVLHGVSAAPRGVPAALHGMLALQDTHESEGGGGGNPSNTTVAILYLLLIIFLKFSFLGPGADYFKYILGLDCHKSFPLLNEK